MNRKIYQEVRLQRRIVALRRRCEHKTTSLSHKSAQRNPGDPRAVLTWREYEVLSGIASAACDEEIAKKLNINLTEVKADINNIYKKLNAPNRLQAILWAMRYL